MNVTIQSRNFVLSLIVCKFDMRRENNMHPQLAEAYKILEMTDALRNELMDLLTDDDLKFALENNLTLGALCREMGEVQQSYLDSFKTLKQDWAYRVPNATELESSVEKLKTWYAKLNADMKAALEAHTEDDAPAKIIDRGFPMSLGAQVHTYREALLIFYAKASVYLRVMGKTIPEQWAAWIG